MVVSPKLHATMQHHRPAPPPGIQLLRYFARGRGRIIRYEAYRTSILLLTFLAYALYHASRKPPSIVKSVLQSSHGPFDAVGYSHPGAPSFPWPLNRIYISQEQVLRESGTKASAKGWSPFDGKSGTGLLGQVDLAFLASYALGMFFAGHFADRLSLRWFLAIGMMGTGLCVCLFGMAFWWDIHQLTYFLAVQIVAGLFQSTGWPSVVAVIGNWFGKRKRGLIMGIWNAHTSVGNIAGSLMAAGMLHYGWGWSFVLPGAVIAVGGVLIFLFLVEDPIIVELPSPYEALRAQQLNTQEANLLTDSEKTDTLNGEPKHGSERIPLLRDEEAGLSINEEAADCEHREKAVRFLQAFNIPGVVPFALCLFFAKLVAYTFLYWLPFYIRHTAIGGHYLSDRTAGNLSTIFDIGGVFGGILAGHISDKLNARAITAVSFMYLAIPVLLSYLLYGGLALWLNLIILFIAGFFVNGPYALITTAVSADLGTHMSLKGNARALATVTAIIDGTGSVGAALGPVITGYLSATGWNAVFMMLMLSALMSGLLLTKLVIEEVKERLQGSKDQSSRN